MSIEDEYVRQNVEYGEVNCMDMIGKVKYIRELW